MQRNAAATAGRSPSGASQWCSRLRDTEYGRAAALTDLQQLTDDSAIPRVQLTTPKPGPAERAVTLPGNVVAWNEAPIYAQVSRYVTTWYKARSAPERAATLW